MDDEPGILEVIVIYLEKMGYTVYQANDGVSAFEVLKQHRHIDLLVTDVIMPGGMSGSELAQMACELVPHLKVIYCSGLPFGQLDKQTKPLHHGPLLNKPYRLAELGALIRSIMSGGRGDIKTV